MVTFEQAKEIVHTTLEAGWLPGAGTLYVAPDGFEDRQYWLVRAGAREGLVDGDPRYLVYEACELVVDKRTGEFGVLEFCRHQQRLEHMTPVRG